MRQAQRFKAGDLVMVNEHNFGVGTQATVMLLISFHPAKSWSINYPCAASELTDYWTVLIGEHPERRRADYINEYCEKLND